MSPPLADGTDKIVIPWSGEVFGTADFLFISGRARPFVVAPVGLSNAGKTTLLAALYLHLSRGAQFPGWQFAGSFTLEAWEKISHSLRWKLDEYPAFPPHTSRGDDRTPGFLHLGLKPAGNGLKDILIADAPGEWFASWAEASKSPAADPLRFIAGRADAFLIVIDTEALAGTEMNTARFDLRQLVLRVRDVAGDRPVLVVWAKADLHLPPDVEASISKMLSTLLPAAMSIRVIAAGKEHQSDAWVAPFLEAFVSLFEPRRDVSPLDSADREEALFSDAFFAYRR